ncbi:MAG TPA: tRNA (adenine-N1)-methyltransferase [Acidimicrobiales bacterium]|nr:tRNA (adenine-N1)-methyltransferase [Acidimicrobiales bacterium]
MSGPLAPGDKVLLVDRKDRRYLVTLTEGGEFHTHAGVVPHADIVAAGEGGLARATTGAAYIVLRPTLSDFILKMPRGAQVIYPKDLGAILVLADVYPGVRVLEAGVGSGALSTALLRAGAHVTGYEVREDFALRARANVTSFLGADALERYHVEIRDIYEGIDPDSFDRIILDLPEPWRVVKHAETALAPGGLLVAYVPSVTQVAQLRDTLDESSFGLAETVEVLVRGWHVAGQAVRPDHRMVGHTGFLTAARLLHD